jgi:glycosyltransferase involved in cell wall biosynthesis
MTLRVLHCIPSMGAGGAEKQLVAVSAQLAARGHELDVALIHDGVLMDRIDPRVRVHRLRASGNHDPRIFLQLRSLVQKLRPRIVQTWLPQMDILGGTAARTSGVKWLLTERSSALGYPPTMKNKLRVRVGRKADAIVANSAGGLQFWRDHGARTALTRVIPNIVPSPKGSIALEAKERPVIVYVGRLNEGKNLLTLVDAAARVLARVDADVLFCGAGPMQSELESAIAERRVSNRVRVLGYVADVEPVIRRADVFVSISRFEGQPNAVLEAAAFGCPLVLSDIAAHREFLDETSATFVSGDDADAAANALVAALENREAAQARATRASLRVAPFTADAVASAYEDVYLQLAGGS